MENRSARCVHLRRVGGEIRGRACGRRRRRLQTRPSSAGTTRTRRPTRTATGRSGRGARSIRDGGDAHCQAGRRGRGDAARSARRIRQPGIVGASAGGVSRPSPPTLRRRPTSRRTRASKLRGRSRRREPQESSPLSPTPHGVDSRRALARCFNTPGTRRRARARAEGRGGNGRSPRGGPASSVATLTLPTGRVVLRSPQERAWRSGRPDAWGATPSRSASRGRARSRLREPPCRSVRARGLQLERSSGGEEPHEGHDPRVELLARAARGRASGTREEERSEVDGASRG